MEQMEQDDFGGGIIGLSQIFKERLVSNFDFILF